MEQTTEGRISSKDRIFNASKKVEKLLYVSIDNLVEPQQRKAPLSVNTSEAFAWAAGILSDPSNLPATGLSDLKGIVDRFRGRLAECCRERGQKALVNKTDIQRALVSLGWTTAKTSKKRR